MTSLVSLGDSFTCGEGVGLRVPLAQTWTGLIAGALPDTSQLQLAAPGARVRDVVERQLPLVRDARIATLLVGLNDVARGGFERTQVHDGLVQAAHGLCRAADTVLLGRLHDPVRLLRVPGPLRRVVRDRLDIVNAAIDEAARLPRVHVVDLETIPALQGRSGWAVDRVHPSLSGHAAMAQAAAQVLRGAGHRVPALAAAPRSEVPSRTERLWWLSRHGIPYVAGTLTTRKARSGGG